MIEDGENLGGLEFPVDFSERVPKSLLIFFDIIGLVDDGTLIQSRPLFFSELAVFFAPFRRDPPQSIACGLILRGLFPVCSCPFHLEALDSD